MDSSEEEELFLLGFLLLDDKREKKKNKQEVFSNLLCELELGDREYYFKLVSF